HPYDPLFKHFGVAGGRDSENGNDWALRGQLLFKLSDKSELLFIARAAKEDVSAGAGESRSPPPTATVSTPFCRPAAISATAPAITDRAPTARTSRPALATRGRGHSPPTATSRA